MFHIAENTCVCVVRSPLGGLQRPPSFFFFFFFPYFRWKKQFVFSAALKLKLKRQPRLCVCVRALLRSMKGKLTHTVQKEREKRIRSAVGEQQSRINWESGGGKGDAARRRRDCDRERKREKKGGWIHRRKKRREEKVLNRYWNRREGWARGVQVCPLLFLANTNRVQVFWHPFAMASSPLSSPLPSLSFS